MTMVWVGIDPGKLGGYAYIAGGVVKAFPWENNFFVRDMRGLTSLHNGGIIATVEQVHAVHGNGIVSSFTFGKSAGYIEGVLTALEIPYQLVPPTVWKKEFSLIGKDKQASIDTCRQLFPGVNLKRTERCRKDGDGPAEALLICTYGMRHFGGGEKT
jgi:crossover junction endodeoxyribonuclease RuvC